jgi:hypothetical protein
MRTLWAFSALVTCATGFAPTTRRATSLRGSRPTSLQMSAAPPPPPPPETLAVPAAATGRALLSWGNAPYIAGAAFVGYRGYKTVSNIKEKQNKLIDEFGGKLKLGKKQSKAQFEATKKLYGKKLMFLPRGPALFASGLKAICTKKVSINSLNAFRDLCDVFGITKADQVASAVESSVAQTNARGKALFYASRSGLSSPRLTNLALEGLDGKKEFLQATQDGYAQQAYIASLGKSAPYTANPQAAQALGLDAAEAQLILDDLNAEPDPDADKEDWQKELEAKVVEETGADSASSLNFKVTWSRRGRPRDATSRRWRLVDVVRATQVPSRTRTRST